LVPSAPAASAVDPSQPSITTSIVVGADCARLVRISGQDSASVARASSRQAARVPPPGRARSVMRRF
jgi:hypothetical protein